MFAQVIIDVAHASVDKIFEYIIPQGMDLALGHRVLVPFGFSNKKIEGFVIGFSETIDFDISKAKTIFQPCESYPVLTTNQIELAHKMRKAYGCTLADAFRLMLPGRLHGLKEKKQLFVSLINYDISELFYKSGKVKAPAQLDILNLLKESGDMFLSKIDEKISGASSAVKNLEKKGLVAISEKQIIRSPYEGAVEEKSELKLKDEQQNAVDSISKQMFSGKTFLIHGVTGSGKTEVYIRLIKACLKAQKQAIVLVPEIALTPQAVERYRAHFGSRVAVLHSRLSGGERFDEWQRVLLGECDIALGARSAVFAPMEDIGLIVVDEEHEDSYSSDTFPRYDAREIAKMRIEDSGSVVLGSATPAIETYFSAMNGEIELLEMMNRANAMQMPQTFLVDMKQELVDGNKSLISNFLADQIKEKLEKREQIILLLNKRGYASFVMCRGCGHVIRCPHCDVSLAYHKLRGDKLTCHYCGYEEHLTKVCPECGKPYLKHFGVGTQQVQEQVEMVFPQARIARMDYDTTRGKDAHLHLYQQFMRGDYDILIGTQMIAKGLDFPNVTLVGIISADNMLQLPDYRSTEKTFSLITQASGRAGRAQKKGEVIIQTYIPNDVTIQAAMKQDYLEFYKTEIRKRRSTEYPPFGKFIRILVLSADFDLGLEILKELNEELREKVEEIKSELIFITSSTAPIRKINDINRFQVLIKMKNSKKTAQFAAEIFELVKKRELPKNLYLDFEINPKNML